MRHGGDEIAAPRFHGSFPNDRRLEPLGHVVQGPAHGVELGPVASAPAVSTSLSTALAEERLSASAAAAPAAAE